jgi:hypothetical protein
MLPVKEDLALSLGNVTAEFTHVSSGINGMDNNSVDALTLLFELIDHSEDLGEWRRKILSIEPHPLSSGLVVGLERFECFGRIFSYISSSTPSHRGKIVDGKAVVHCTCLDGLTCVIEESDDHVVVGKHLPDSFPIEKVSSTLHIQATKTSSLQTLNGWVTNNDAEVVTLFISSYQHTPPADLGSGP